jgi:hypothetical protein
MENLDASVIVKIPVVEGKSLDRFSIGKNNG